MLLDQAFCLGRDNRREDRHFVYPQVNAKDQPKELQNILDVLVLSDPPLQEFSLEYRKCFRDAVGGGVYAIPVSRIVFSNSVPAGLLVWIIGDQLHES
jgi:hypothetical protein